MNHPEHQPVNVSKTRRRAGSWVSYALVLPIRLAAVRGRGEHEGHGGPAGGAVGDELRFAIREAGLEVVVGRNGALVDEPGAILLLRVEQVLDAALIGWVRRLHITANVERVERFAGG